MKNRTIYRSDGTVVTATAAQATVVRVSVKKSFFARMLEALFGCFCVLLITVSVRATSQTVYGDSSNALQTVGSDFAVAPSSGIMIGGIDDNGKFAPISVDRHHGYTNLHVASLGFEADRADEGYMFNISKTQTLATPGANYNLLLIVNLSTNTLSIYPWRIVFDVDVATAQVSYKIYKDPVVTSSGTYADSLNMYFGGVAASTSAVAQIYTGPSVSSVGTQFDAFSASGAESLIVERKFEMVIGPGSTVLMRANPNVASQITTTYKWVEAE